MKILHLTKDIDTGGITQYIFATSKKLIPLGCEVFVVSSGGSFESRFQELGIQTATFDLRTKSELSPKLLFSFPKIAAFIKENKIDVIHAHTRVTQVLAHHLSKKLGIPYITTCHGFFKRRLGRKILPAWGKQVIAISRGVQEDLEKQFKVLSENIAFIPNGIEMESFEAKAKEVDLEAEKRKLGIQDKSPVIGIVSRITREKGIDILVRAFKLLESKYPKAQLLVAGEGKYFSEVEKIVQELRLRDRITFLGHEENVIVPYLLMDLFVLPATGPEGFGFVVIEAMTLKKPVIVSDIRALNTLIEDGKNGWLTTPGNPEDLAQKIDFSLSHPEVTRNVTTEAYRNVQEEYTLDKMAEKIFNVYQGCLTESSL